MLPKYDSYYIERSATTVPRTSAKELFILGRVSLRPSHGHEIMSTLREAHADLWVDLSEKHVYYILRKLDEKGLVTAHEERAGALPARRVYSITDSGRAALAEMLAAESLVMAHAYSDFDVLLGMICYTDVLGDEARNAIVSKRLTALELRRAELSADAKRAQEEGLSGFPELMLNRIIDQLSSEIEWLTALSARVRSDGWASMRPDMTARGIGQSEQGPSPRG